MKTRLILTYIFNIFDLIVTMYLVRLFGLSIEGNPIGRWLIKTNLQYFVKIVIIGALLLEIGKLSKGNCKYCFLGYDYSVFNINFLPYRNFIKYLKEIKCFTIKQLKKFKRRPIALVVNTLTNIKKSV